MKPLAMPALTAEQIDAVATLYRTTHHVRLRTVVRAAAGRLVLLYLPTYSPWLNPMESLWRQFRREVTHNVLFQTVRSLLAAARDFFDRYNQEPSRMLPVIGSHAQNVL